MTSSLYSSYYISLMSLIKHGIGLLIVGVKAAEDILVLSIVTLTIGKLVFEPPSFGAVLNV